MYIIRPIEITDAILTDTDVPEADYTEFSMGTTYGAGDTRMDTTGVEIITLDVAPASDWEVGDLITGQTSAKTAYVVSKLTSLTYEIRERTGNFTLGEVIGVTGVGAKLADQGAAHPTVTAASDKVHRIYESLKAANTANYPPVNLDGAAPWWLEISATNRWKVCDEKMADQTSKATSMYYEFTPGAVSDAAYLGNLDATSVNFTVDDPVEGEVYNETVNLISTDGIINWYAYFFEQIVRRTDIAKTDLPPYISGVITITITYTGGTALCGEIVIGQKADIGTLLNSPEVGIIDYSRKDTDDFGNPIIVPRAISKRMSIDIEVPLAWVDEVNRILSLYHTTPLVFIANEDYSSMIVYGFYKDFIVVVPAVRAGCSITIEGLT